LSSNKALEASATVEQGSVEIEDHGLDIRQHLFCKTHIRDLPNGQVSAAAHCRASPPPAAHPGLAGLTSLCSVSEHPL
jgi:hypothetical protein